MYPMKKKYLVEMGQRLRAIRLARNLSQTQLAHRIFKSKQVVSAYELGRAEMPATCLVAIAAALDCDVSLITASRDVGEIH